MRDSVISAAGMEFPLCPVNTLIVGSGAAGLNAAVSLLREGQRDIAIVTEGKSMGTSLNTGSDKQTYYKLTCCSGEPDSVRQMAQTLFDGRSGRRHRSCGGGFVREGFFPSCRSGRALSP